MLSLRLLETGREFILDIVTFTKEDTFNYFTLQSSQNSEINITVPYILKLEDSFDPSEFSLVPLTSSLFYKEENIFEVYASNKNRIGWVFPVQSISSNEHSKSENEYFLKYAFVSFYKLMRGEYFETHHVFEVSEVSAQLDVTQIYSSDLIVLCLSENKTKQIAEFDITNYIHSLYSYKYFLVNSPSELNNTAESGEIDEFNSLKLSEMSTFLKKEIFIKSLFKDLLRKSNHPLVHFHLLYQIVELLINRVYDCEIEKILQISKSRTKRPHDLLEAVKELQKEEFRIKRLIDNYLKGQPGSRSELMRLCNLLLKEFNKEKTHVGEAFYQFRNTVVHEFRSIAEIDPSFTLFRQINTEFEKFLIETITNYTESDESKWEKKPLAWLIYQLLIAQNQP